MWPFQLFNVVLAMVSNELSESDLDEDLFNAAASVTMSIHFSEVIRQKILQVLRQLKEWQLEGTFSKKVSTIIYNYFEPDEIVNAEDLIPEDQVKDHLIGLAILHYWTTTKEDLSAYEEKIEELRNILTLETSNGKNKKSLEEAVDKLTEMMEKNLEL